MLRAQRSITLGEKAFVNPKNALTSSCLSCHTAEHRSVRSLSEADIHSVNVPDVKVRVFSCRTI